MLLPLNNAIIDMPLMITAHAADTPCYAADISSLRRRRRRYYACCHIAFFRATQMFRYRYFSSPPLFFAIIDIAATPLLYFAARCYIFSSLRDD